MDSTEEDENSGAKWKQNEDKLKEQKEKRAKKPTKKTTNPKKNQSQKGKIKAKTKQLAKEKEKKRVNGKKLPRDIISITPGQTEATLTPSCEGLICDAEVLGTRGSCDGVQPPRRQSP